jgi:hypothetical protein
METLMTKLILLTLCFSVLIGCAKSKPEPEDFEIINQQLKTVTAEDGAKLFSYLVTVKAGSAKLINKKRQLTKSEIKKLLQQENFIDSSSLKMDLEDKAAMQLEAELKKQNYCQDSYQIEEVKWRDYSVRLSGRCDD